MPICRRVMHICRKTTGKGPVSPKIAHERRSPLSPETTVKPLESAAEWPEIVLGLRICSLLTGNRSNLAGNASRSGLCWKRTQRPAVARPSDVLHDPCYRTRSSFWRGRPSALRPVDNRCPRLVLFSLLLSPSMEDTPKFPMAKAGKIIRTSIYTFLRSYHFFTTTAALLVFPFSVSVLLTQAYLPYSSSLLPTIFSRLRILFDAAGFPLSSELFIILSQKLSQTVFSSIFTLPFSLTFLLITKGAIIQALKQNKPTLPPSFSSVVTLYKPLLLTYLCNSILILSANATVFCLLFFAFTFFDGFGFSSPNALLFLSAGGALLYSVILANALIVSSLALVLSGMERCGGYMAILKACVLLPGRASTALSLALPVNIALAAVEALFQYRVVGAYYAAGELGVSMALEGIFIAYLYSIFIVLDTIVICTFFKSCKTDCRIKREGRHCYRIEFAGEDSDGYDSLQTMEELP